MSYWHYDQKTGVHTGDSGPQVLLAVLLLAALLIRVYFGVNWALGAAAFVAGGAAIGWLVCRRFTRPMRARLCNGVLGHPVAQGRNESESQGSARGRLGTATVEFRAGAKDRAYRVSVTKD